MLSEYNSSIMQANNENRIININTHSRPKKLQTLKANISKNPARKSLTQKILYDGNLPLKLHQMLKDEAE